MKNYFNAKKLVKSFVLTTVLTFGLISDGHFTAAAGLDKTKMEPVKNVQVNSAQLQASKKATPAKPKVKVKAKAQHKKKSKIVKSQASVHASATAKRHAASNSAIFAQKTLTESNGTEAVAEYVFGSDSASSANPKGEELYLGKLGYGSKVQFDESTGSGIYFSSARAQKASYVYGYWFLTGIQKAPTGTSASEWGRQQAKLALKTYETMKSVYGSKVRPVIFIDVESALTGMKDNDFANNRSIYNAFVNYLKQYGQGVKPGTYSSTGNWKLTMGDFSPSTPGAYWLAHYPGDIPSDLTTSNSYWGNFPGTNEKAEIWQYYGGNNDYDVAWKLP
ncbi:GH25 family lysozyme [Bacillus salipaludis]|uniref:GH25 family lysozyme n=1 Tax=Bacillus salipaludis TaxID=2547811 RepID=UPI002E1CBE3D|nr:GH25 family lysozyme [Bacillus salipaludis]